MASVNLLRGRPGAGKGYEGVAYHILPAIREGRMVITNMQLNIDYFCSVFGDHCRELLVCLPERTNGRFTFSHIDDYQCDWVHPETGQGPLFIIDECHQPLRKGDQLREVEEWFAKVRHTGANVLLMTQGTRKVNPDILDLVQLTYLVSKVPGEEDCYYRKVIDGLRGQPLNETTREYESWVYPFYKSHTLADSAVTEMRAADVNSLSSHWIFKAKKLFYVITVLCMGYFIYSIGFKEDEPIVVKADPKPISFSKAPSADFTALEQSFTDKPAAPVIKQQAFPEDTVYDADPRDSLDHPFKGFGIAVKGSIRMGGVDTYLVSFGQNGTTAFSLSSAQLATQGYSVEPIGDCLMLLTYKDSFQKYITCSYHTVSVTTSISGT